MRGSAYAALDLGAESARVMVGRLDGGRVALEQLHRVASAPVRLPDGLHWDLVHTYGELVAALDAHPEPLQGIGVDAWGVDYALLDEHGALLGLPYHYRDARTDGMIERAAGRVPPAEAYAVTGIQTMPINTVYQLLAEAGPALGAAARIALVPDLVAYWLSGVLANESTAASTTALLDARSGRWATGLIERLGLPARIFGELAEPGTHLGAHAGTPVYAVAGHDTASAFAAAPIDGRGCAILSSGTWSLLGLELPEPVLDDAARAANLTNERGVEGTTRLLKNVMGLWLVQCCRRALAAAGTRLGYDEVVALAAAHAGEVPLFDPDDPSLLADGADMPARIARLCDRPLPAEPAVLFRSILVSLACKYRRVLELLEAVSGRAISAIHVIGGGAQNALLCRLTAELTGRLVLAGPVEATALGNVLVQARAGGELGSLAEMRELVTASFPLARFEPSADRGPSEAAYARFQEIARV